MKCFICKKQGYTETHHIFGGSNRTKSERDGLKVDLCMDCHRTGKHAVHKDAEVMLRLHQYGQRLYMAQHNCTEEEFIKIYGKNYEE